MTEKGHIPVVYSTGVSEQIRKADMLRALDLLLVAETWEQIQAAKQFAAKTIKKATKK